MGVYYSVTTELTFGGCFLCVVTNALCLPRRLGVWVLFFEGDACCLFVSFATALRMLLRPNEEDGYLLGNWLPKYGLPVCVARRVEVVDDALAPEWYLRLPLDEGRGDPRPCSRACAWDTGASGFSREVVPLDCYAAVSVF